MMTNNKSLMASITVRDGSSIDKTMGQVPMYQISEWPNHILGAWDKFLCTIAAKGIAIDMSGLRADLRSKRSRSEA